MIKAIMMIQRGIILPNADFEAINPKIEGREILKVSGPQDVSMHIFMQT
jgi:hypothetical protein